MVHIYTSGWCGNSNSVLVGQLFWDLELRAYLILETIVNKPPIFNRFFRFMGWNCLKREVWPFYVPAANFSKVEGCAAAFALHKTGIQLLAVRVRPTSLRVS